MTTTIQSKTIRYRSNSCDGFTLVEVMVALVVITIGILAVNAMQIVAVRGNSSANGLSSASNFAMDQVEEIFALDYDDALLADGTGTNNGAAGLNDNTVASADHNDTSDPIYTILWNVAEEFPMDNIKTINIIVNRNDLGTTKSVTFRYKKARYM